MRSALTVLAALPLLAATKPAPAKPCPRPQMDRADARQPARMQKLGEMPPGKQILGLFREVDGCPTPIVVREEVGQPRR
jgi:hypothetical protein